MTLTKGSKVERGYATVTSDDGVNYRQIADIMCDLGFPMNHSSARNHILRIMQKFAYEFAKNWNIELTEERLARIAKIPEFQYGVADLLQAIEVERRAVR